MKSVATLCGARGRALSRLVILLAVLACAQVARAQCPSTNNVGWARGSTVRYFLDANLSAEQKRQIRWALAEWNRAGSINNARVRFEEDETGGSFQFRFLNGNLGGNAPALANWNFTPDGTIVQATVTYDPNAVFFGTSTLIANPNAPGYENFVIKITLHEVGHTMGLGEAPNIENACQQPRGASVMNYICNVNDSSNNIPLRLTACDQNAINSMPRYPPFNQSPNPVDDARFFVRQHYLDFLNREPDQAGWDFWTNQATNCGNPDPLVCRINVSAAYFLSIEFQETGFLVYRVYKAAFGNISTSRPAPLTIQEFLPEQQEVSRGVIIGQPGAEARLEANKQAWLADFVQRRRFTAAFPSTISSAQFVDTLNQNAGGVLSAAERDGLVNRLNSGAVTRAQALREVAEDEDFKRAEKSRAFVLMQYFGYMRRNPEDVPELNLDFSGYNFWLGKLNQFNGDFIAAEMVKAFITSGEYRARFGAP